MSSTTLRRAVATAFAATLATGGLVATASAQAAAAPTTVTNVTFDWSGSEELQKAPPFGGGNPFTAGTSNGTMTAGAYKAAEGNVSIVHVAADGTESPATFATRNAPTTSDIEQMVRFRKGTGTVDPTDGSGTIAWDGDWSINFYGGLLPFTLSDPVLTVAASGTGTLTADLVGYASDQANPTVKEPLPPVADVTVATFAGVNLTATGQVTVEPDYEGVEVTVDPQVAAAQNRTNAGWGAWPQPFVDFHLDSGLSSYWYSSGGAVDPYKAPNSFTVAMPEPASVSVSGTVANPDGTTTVTVTGQGFDPELAEATRYPICPQGPAAACGKPGGAYVTFGKFADNWQPSTGANGGTTRVQINPKWAVDAADATNPLIAASAVVLSPEGTFTAELTLDKPALDAAVAAKADPSLFTNYGIYTYAGGGPTQALYETYTPITFDGTDPVVTLSGPVSIAEGASANFAIVATDDSGIASSEYSVNGGEWTTISTGAFSLTGLTAGSYDVAVRATDVVGNVGTDSATLEVTAAPAAPPFTDLVGAPFADEIRWLATRGITTGYANGDGTFAYRGSGQVLREQMAAFLYRYQNDGTNPPSSAPNATFSDTTTNTFSKHIAWLAGQNITTGYPNGTFQPSAPVLREQMAAFLYRLAGKPSFTPPATSPFSDVPTSHTFYKEITWLASTKITTGYANGTFQGSAPVLREQMAAFLFRFDYLKK